MELYPTTGAGGGQRGHLICEMPTRERPRERLLATGPDGLGDAELLAILLRTGRRGRSAVDLARDVLVRFEGDLARLASAEIAELRTVAGIGQAKAIEIRAAFALARRLSLHQRQEAPLLESPAQVVKLMRDLLRDARQEEFHALLLDTKNRLSRAVRVTVGLVDRSQVHPREVYRTAIAENCTRLILVHNHPSGDPTPSPQDVSCTRNLVEAGRVIGIEVLDHVIIGAPATGRCRDYLSFRENNLI